jgi:hypothetical protein
MIGSRAEGEAFNQSSSRKNAMCRGAYKTFSTEGTVFSIAEYGSEAFFYPFNRKKRFGAQPVFCLKKRENRTTGRKTLVRDDERR